MIKHHIITAKPNRPKQCCNTSKKQFVMHATFVGFPIPYNMINITHELDKIEKIKKSHFFGI
jgi:hypothetical protein